MYCLMQPFYECLPLLLLLLLLLLGVVVVLLFAGVVVVVKQGTYMSSFCFFLHKNIVDSC